MSLALDYSFWQQRLPGRYRFPRLKTNLLRDPKTPLFFLQLHGVTGRFYPTRFQNYLLNVAYKKYGYSTSVRLLLQDFGGICAQSCPQEVPRHFGREWPIYKNSPCGHTAGGAVH